ncbi:MAG: hypothetical protein IJ325_13815 [Clostridia bacterium]|nr:hypothetical protein [Clostridia bacterium]
MNWKKIGKALLFPPYAILFILLPVSAVFLVCSMVFLDMESVTAIISYALAAYTLTVWCMRIPALIRFFRIFKEENKYIQLWKNNTRLRVKVSLYKSLFLNTAYSVFQLCLGFWHRSFWYFSMAAYYISLAVMRFFLLRYTRKYAAGEKMEYELVKYRNCGIAFLIMNMAVSLMIFFMVYWNRTFHHHEITTIAMAAYTFTSLTLAIRDSIKYRRYNSPVYSASKAIGLAAASVSMLTLESTMLTTFGTETVDLFTRRLFLGLSGGVISACIIAIAIYMIVRGNRKLRETTKE